MQPRHHLPIPLRVELARPDGAASAEYAVNLSAGGLCLHLQDPLQVGDSVEVTFTLPPSGPRVELSGEVVWASPADGAGAGPRLSETGVRFLAVEPAVRELLTAYAEQEREPRR